ncbi:Vitamin B12 transporter BtuB [wastewater metagenome]|uniref:Vitamin B12 transporter BtuB n=3 Tax=root TaxID=1 RepID=A0A5B8R5K2_9ZZZZ|nr:vitamin B12 transporter BtuB [uncultured organism]
MPLPLRKPVHHAVATVTLAVCAPLPGTAAEAGTSALELDPLTVTGTPVPGAVSEQAASLDIVTSDSIVADGDANLGEALADLPGVENIATGNSAGKPVIRGLSGERIRMLSNGVGLDHQQYGVRHMPSYDPFLLERVEVVRGASSVLYGSSALGGAVNLIPREIDYDTDFHGEAMTRYYSNNGQWDTGLRAGAGNGRFGISVGVIRRDAGNIETPDETTYFPPPPNPEHQDAAAYTGDLDYTDFEQAAGDIAVGVRDDRGGEWRLRYTRWNDEHNFLLPPPAGIKPPSAGAEGIGQYIDDEQLSLSGRTRIGNITWKPKLLWQNNERRSNAAGYPRSAGFDHTIDIEFDQYTARLEGEHGAIAGLDGGTVGVEYRYKTQESRGSTQLSPGGDVHNAAVFAFEEKRLGPLLLQSGVRYDHHTTEARASRTRAPSASVRDAEENSYGVATGSLGGVLSMTDRLSLAANVERGFRAPSLFELYVAGQHGGVAAYQEGDPDLDEETSLNTDLSLRWQSPGLRATATVYRNVINDYIMLQDTGGTHGGLPVLRYEQADATLHGVELSVEKTLAPWLTLTAAAEMVDGERDDNGDDLPLLPADNISVGARFTPASRGWLRNPHASVTVRHYASKDAAPGEPFSQFDDAPFGSASTDSYTLVGMSAGFSPRVGNRVIHLDLSVSNLLNEDYRAFLDTYKGYALSPGRDIRLTLRVPFGG